VATLLSRLLSNGHQVTDKIVDQAADLGFLVGRQGIEP
jgi:hypothetical protein